MKNLRNEEAVSPVIGVILMVVITVIIAAVLAVFAFGVGAPTKTPQASIKITSVDTANDNITVQHYGGDSLRLKDVKLTIETLNGDGVITNTTVFDILPAATGQFEAGDTILLSAGATKNILLNGASIGTGNFTAIGGVDLSANTETVRVTIIDTPSGSVLSKPSAKVT
jgi:flagellin-like protein